MIISSQRGTWEVFFYHAYPTSLSEFGMAERPFPTIRLPTDGEIDAFTLVHPTGVEFRHPEAVSAIECFEIPDLTPAIDSPVHHTRPRQGVTTRQPATVDRICAWGHQNV